MLTSRTTTFAEPKDATPVRHTTLVYFRSRLRRRIFNAIIREFKRSGLSKADLARRLDKDPAQVSRVLLGPGNITLDTASDFLFCISGGEISTNVDFPLTKRMKLVNTLDKPITSSLRREIAFLEFGDAKFSVDLDVCEMIA